jgi:ubiquilin
VDNNFKTVKLKVLLKEESFEVSCADNATVLQLKHAIASQSEIPIIQQRLIFSGRQLKPDEKLLSTFKIINNSTIHLFPIPCAKPVVTSEVTSILV